jgi:hypothetical protein
MSPFGHFIQLAQRGEFRGASGGEVRANKLALAVLENVPGLDQDAVSGLIEFIALTANAPTTAEEIFKSNDNGVSHV